MEAAGTNIVNIRAEIKRQSDEIAKKIGAPSGDFIKVQQDKTFKLPDGAVSPGPIRGVIVDFTSANMFYDRPYKEGEVVPPACFAIGEEPEALVPSNNSPDKQSDNGCKPCVNNVFGSKGRGKACTNTRILAIVQPDADPNSPLWLLKVSPTAIKAFDAYVQTIKAQFDGTPILVETDIYFASDEKFPSLRFGNPTENKNLAVHFARQKAAKERLLAEPDVSQYAPPPPPPAAPVRQAAKPAGKK